MDRSHDQDGRIASIESAGFHGYSHDEADRITGLTDAQDSNRTWTYGYDALDRLTSAGRTGFGQGFGYDANGNRLTKTGNNAQSYTIAPSSNRLLGVSGAEPKGLTYDPAGNLTGDGSATFSYDGAGRLSGYGGYQYHYNGLGQRTRKQLAQSWDDLFFYDESGRLLSSYFKYGYPWGSHVGQETIWLDDIPVAAWLWSTEYGGDLQFMDVHTDHLNAPRRLRESGTGEIPWRWDSDPFGAELADTDPDNDHWDLDYNRAAQVVIASGS